MFQSKSFNLVHEEKAKKSDNFYEPKHCRWLKYIVIPALIGFALLLILLNVDFSGKDVAAATKMTTESTVVTTVALQTDVVSTQEKVSPSTTVTVTNTEWLMSSSSMQTEASTTNMADDATQDRLSHRLVLKETITNAAICSTPPNDVCLVNCSNGDLIDLHRELDSYEQYCEDDMHVILDNCLFPSGNMFLTFFPCSYYCYHLRILEIIKGNLVDISDGAFQSSSTRNMQELSINSTALSKLTERTFDGLQFLQVLKWLNLPKSTKFEGTKFLQPVAGTIKELLLCQLSEGDVYDPFSWLDGVKSFPLLTRVDLSNNNFGDTLNAKTFGNLIVVRELILANSSITNIGKDTFKNILGTLEYLDLSLNRLHALDVSTLATKATLRLELHGNDWNCVCENEQLIVAIKAKKFSYTIEPRCVAPVEWENTPMSEVILNCAGEMPPTTQKPVETTPTPPEPPVTGKHPCTTEPPVTQEPPDLPKPPCTAKPPVSTKSPSPPPITPPPITPPKTPAPPITFPVTPSTSAETSESNETPTTPPPSWYALLQCQSTKPSDSYFIIAIRHFDARFTVNSDTSTSAVLLINSDMKGLMLIYFVTNNYTVSDAEKVPNENISNESIKVNSYGASTSTSFTKIHVQGLLSNKSYVFCLVPEIERTVSPLNCQAHFTGVQKTKNGSAWLLTYDKAWCITLFIFGILLAVALGLLTIYWLLRWRPTWLRGCKRIIRAAATSDEVFLLPKQQNRAAAEESNYNMSTCLDFESYDYMQFFKDIQDARPRRRPHSVQASLVPTERAPAVPQTSDYYMQFYRDQQSAKVCRRPAILKVYTIPEEPAPAVPQQQSRTTSMQSTLPTNDLIEQYLDMEEDDGNIYQSISYYELLF